TEDPKLLTNKEDVKKWSKSYYDVYGIASLVKALAPDRYMELLRFHIYQHDFYDELVAYCKNKSIRSRDRSNLDRRYSLLKAVARLCISPLVNAIVTFNYDGLLDTAIEAVRAERSRTGKKSVNSQRSSNPMIIRTHGYLSSPHSIFKGIDQDVVLSHDEYFEMQREPESMETSTPLHLLRNSAALFVGASLKDWNMLRLLEYASPEHEGCGTYCLLSEEDMGTLKNFGDEDLGRVAMRMHATLLNFFGVKLLSAGILRENIPEEVDLIRESLLKPMDDVR
ncbi:MAG: hypothetical protein GXO75_19730, partial [Calditrichaeota bacterium]|nr:hypothetical protein [Calditrichota bacterium]